MSKIQTSIAHENSDRILVTSFPDNNVVIRDLVQSAELDPAKDEKSLQNTIRDLSLLLEKMKNNENALQHFDGRFFRTMQYIGKTVFTSGHLIITVGEHNHVEIKIPNYAGVISDLENMRDAYEKISRKQN